MPDRILTPVGLDSIDPGLGSVFARDISPVRNFRFSDSTVAETDPSHQFSGGDGDQNAPEDRGRRETEDVDLRLEERDERTAAENAEN